ncbi:MAG: NYN domain-containing protein [Gammaproteobacteria bacterium]|nr:NYN domain-containing protein [Gammaproteobacteria bacterium]
MKYRFPVSEDDVQRVIDRTYRRVKKYLKWNGTSKVFGNGDYLQDKLDTLQYRKNGNDFIETPAVNKYGKTCADGLIMAEMIRDLEHVDRVILFTSDVDFYPTCELLVELEKEVVIISHGYTNNKLRDAGTLHIPISKFGIHWGDMKDSQFKRKIITKSQLDFDRWPTE